MPSDALFFHAPAGAGGSLIAAVREVATQARARLPWLWWGGWAMLAVSLPLLLLIQVDARTLNGVNVWIKPWKFHVSAGVHLLTLAWCAALLRPTPQRARAFGAMSAMVLATAVVELAYITWRAALGEASHFNTADPFAAAMYTLMGVMAVLLLGGAGVVGWWILRARDFEHGPVLQRGLGLALVLGWLLGTVAGAYMGGQTSHGVGASPPEALAAVRGLPVVGWLREAGDLRVAHFFGMHAMHVIGAAALLAAWWAALKGSTASAASAASAASGRASVVAHRGTAAALAALYAFAAVYVGFTVFTFVQAVKGQPFL